jgi:large subunit ribosomal protein L25
MKQIVLAAETRVAMGKGPARQTRRDGRIPAVIYGPETEPKVIAVDQRALMAAIRSVSGASTLMDLELDGKTSKVIMREVQRDPVTSEIIHVDFHAVSMTKPIHVAIQIRVVGTAIGVKRDGGILQINMRELEILCLPDQIPGHIEVDVSELAIGDSIHVKNLSLPKDVNVVSEPSRTVLVIGAPTVVKADEPTAEEIAAAEAEAATEAAGEGAEGKSAEKAEGDKKE